MKICTYLSGYLEEVWRCAIGFVKFNRNEWIIYNKNKKMYKNIKNVQKQKIAQWDTEISSVSHSQILRVA